MSQFVLRTLNLSIDLSIDRKNLGPNLAHCSPSPSFVPNERTSRTPCLTLGLFYSGLSLEETVTLTVGCASRVSPWSQSPGPRPPPRNRFPVSGPPETVWAQMTDRIFFYDVLLCHMVAQFQKMIRGAR